MADTQPHRVGARGRPRDEDLTHRLLIAALTLIDDHGYAALHPEAVTRRAGASKSAFYARWSTCAELTAHALRVHSPIAATADTGSLRGDLTGLLQPWTRPVDRDERVCGQLLGPARHDELLRAALEHTVVVPLTRSTTTITARHVARGHPVPITGQRLLTRIVVAMWWDRSLAHPAPWPTAELPRVVDQALLPILDTAHAPRPHAPGT